MRIFWKPMPYFIMRDREFLKNMKKNKVSQGISALKIFIFICLKSEVDENGILSAGITYDEFSQYCSLSRRLISEGLRYLENSGVIRVKGEKKKRYILINCKRTDSSLISSDFTAGNGHWCKLPYRGLVDENNRITAFESMKNRSIHELNALRIFLYLLMIRSKEHLYSSVTIRTIYRRLSISYQEVMIAIGYMQSLGLIVRVDAGTNTVGNYDEKFALAFLVCGWESLDWKPKYLSDAEWKKDVFGRFN